MIADLVTAGMCGTALVLFGRGIYHSGVLAGWIVQGIKQEAPPPPAPPEDAWDAYCRKAEAVEQALFLETGMWWLDPNRWGEDPDWRDRIPAAIRPKQKITPASRPKVCPTCHSWDRVSVTAEHGGKASAWHCSRCKVDYTAAGLSKRSRIDEVKQLQAQMRALDAGLLSPAELRPPMVYGEHRHTIHNKWSNRPARPTR